jgi:hypothetical protein
VSSALLLFLFGKVAEMEPLRQCQSGIQPGRLQRNQPPMLEPEVHHFSASRSLREGRHLDGNILAQGRMRIYINSEGLKGTRHGALKKEDRT